MRIWNYPNKHGCLTCLWSDAGTPRDRSSQYGKGQTPNIDRSMFYTVGLCF